MKNVSQKIIAIVLSFLLLFPLSISAQAPVKLWVNGGYVYSDVYPFIENDRTMVPIRVISENLGFDVGWDPTAYQVSISNEVNTIFLDIGYNEANVNGKTYIMDVAPKIVGDRTFVPLRFVAEIMGYPVDWDGENRVAIVGDDYNYDNHDFDSYEDNLLKLYVDGQFIQPKLSPYFYYGEVMFPASYIEEYLGGSVDYFVENGLEAISIYSPYDELNLVMYEGHPIGIRSEGTYNSYYKPHIINGELMVPGSYIAGYLGYDTGLLEDELAVFYNKSHDPKAKLREWEDNHFDEKAAIKYGKWLENPNKTDKQFFDAISSY